MYLVILFLQVKYKNLITLVRLGTNSKKNEYKLLLKNSISKTKVFKTFFLCCKCFWSDLNLEVL